MAEYFKTKGTNGQMDFTEVNSDFKNRNKKGSFGNIRDQKEVDKRFFQANLVNMQNQHANGANGKKRRNI